jgi:adenylosuccinate lyase
MDNTEYQNPLTDRYCSREMSVIFGKLHMHKIWRKLWIVLAECQRELGLDISQAQIDSLKQYSNDINWDSIQRHETETRHDVMAAIMAYGEQAKLAKPIIHLGATSNYIKDNADLIVFEQALQLLKSKILVVANQLRDFCIQYKDMPTLGWTHLQPAQLTTVGKRAALWLHDLMHDYDTLCDCVSRLRLRGVKGTTGTQASFVELFEGDYDKVVKLDNLLACKLGYNGVYALTGQTYSRKVDWDIINVLSSIAQSASKFGTDMRLLASIKELEEPFESGQIGSSAMAYKRNPMRSERMCGIARFVMTLPINASVTASSQWLERTLDDSANRRIVMSQAFLAADSILNLWIDITSGIVVYPQVIARNINAELPFMVTEKIIMQGVKLGGDRQELHEAIRKHSMVVARDIKLQGMPNTLIDRLCKDKLFGAINFDNLLQPQLYIGRSGQQVQEYIDQVVQPVLVANKSLIDNTPIHKVSI